MVFVRRHDCGNELNWAPRVMAHRGFIERDFLILTSFEDSLLGVQAMTDVRKCDNWHINN